MANKMLIVHGYSDGSTSFTALRDFFVEQRVYKKENIYLLDYSSMDDDATFRDFADKLDTDYVELFGNERIDVACHSTGALVTRAWLALRYERRRRRQLDMTCPVHRLLMFAPANFGSDLAGMGQSFLGKFRTTFFNTNSFSEDFMESGKKVLQGLEPASPFQWELSGLDLHPEPQDGCFFNPKAPENQRCYPFVLAAGEGYGGLQAKIIPKRNKAGTDGTVRIAGTSLNTRFCVVDFRQNNVKFSWYPETKYTKIPFAVFAGFNHGSIIDPKKTSFMAPHGPGTLALKALEVNNLNGYAAAATRFNEANDANYTTLKGSRRDRYQQFFFRVRDDVNIKVDDYFVDFYVLDQNDKPHGGLTQQFDRDFEAEFYQHSADPACRVMMLNCAKLDLFVTELRKAKAKLVFDITAKPPLPNVSYEPGHYVVFDGAKKEQSNGQWSFIYPNTTTLVDIVLNRQATSKILTVKDGDLGVAVPEAKPPGPQLSGRALLLSTGRKS